jgi:8-oxo-dGTP diphosphatase
VEAPSVPQRLADIDFSAWQARDRATITFIVRGGEVLLIRKLRGLGAGKVNGPGGKLEPGETPLAGAIREVEEEIGVTPLDLEERAELRFQFVDGYSIHAHVFVAGGFRGEPHTTPEAVPFWASRDALPFSEMWADDILWLPDVLNGATLHGYFVFDGDSMVDSRIEELVPPSR